MVLATFWPSFETWSISLAATAHFSASFLTSAATTANPFPFSPALAASTAALRARMLVWKAMSSIIDIFEAMSFMAETELAAAWLQFWSVDEALKAIFSVSLAFSLFCWIPDAISSIDEETSSAEDACSFALWLIFMLAALSSLLVVEISLAHTPISLTICWRFSVIFAIEFWSFPISSFFWVYSIDRLKSPSAILPAVSIPVSRGLTMFLSDFFAVKTVIKIQIITPVRRKSLESKSDLLM